MTLILKANHFLISIARIIRNKDICYSTNTKPLLIEDSIFNAAKIGQQLRLLEFRTDRLYRYEKSLKNTYLLKSFYRLICLLRIENPNLVCKLYPIAQPLKQNIQIISLNYKSIKEVLGPIKETENNEYKYMAPKIITNSLERLKFKVHYEK